MSLKLDESISEYESFLTLRCSECEYVECPIIPNGTYWKGKQGCTRKVLKNIEDAYEHYFKEVLPFWKTYSSEKKKRSYQEIIKFLYNEIYSAPLGQKLNSDGKVITTS